MSLLAEILQRIRQPEISRQIPPNLKEIVQNSALNKYSKKRLMMLGALFSAAIISGFFVVNIITSGIENRDSISISSKEGVQHQEMKITETPKPLKKEQTVHGKQIVKSVEKVKKEPPVNKVKKRSQVTTGVSEKKQHKKRAVNKIMDLRARDEYLYIARKHELSGDYLKALRYYNKALKFDPDSAQILNNIAYMYIKLNNPSMANRFSRKALKIKSDYIPAMVNLSIGLAMEGKYDMAEEVLQRALKIDEHNREIILNLAILYERQKRFDTAMEYYTRLAGFGDINGDLGMARIYEKRHEYDKARAIYRRLISSHDIDKNTASYVRKRLMLIGNKIYLDNSR